MTSTVNKAFEWQDRGAEVGTREGASKGIRGKVT